MKFELKSKTGRNSVIAPRNMITRYDKTAVESFLLQDAPLSGYLAGNPHGGAAVQRLEEWWKSKYDRRHAIAVNSATSGLFAAALAVGVKNTQCWVPSLSMSATAAMPRFLGGELRWMDTNSWGGQDYDATMDIHDDSSGCVVFLTSLFGHPPDKRWLEYKGTGRMVILDNAQGINATCDDIWAENMGTITVTSFNVHKQVNTGEGGIISTDDDYLARKMRMFINHGENVGYDCGFNLRMPEISAVLALSQLQRIDITIKKLRAVCEELNNMLPIEFGMIAPQDGESGCYTWQFHVDPDKRHRILGHLIDQGIPCSAMYEPTYKLPAFMDNDISPRLPHAEYLSRSTIVFEISNWRYEDDAYRIGKAFWEASKL